MQVPASSDDGHDLGDLTVLNGASTRATGSRRRVVAVDVARALAIFGMLAVHIGPTDVDGVAGRMFASPHGRASILFALVAGIGVSLLVASPNHTRGGARLRLVWRAALLLPVGLALQELDHGANVILQDYALLFLLAAVALGLSDRWLLGLAAVSATLGPAAFLWGRTTAPSTFDRGSTALTDAPGEILQGLVLTGPYPLITWAAPFLLGMWLGRRDLLAPRLRARLVVAGGIATVATLLASRTLLSLLGSPVEPVGIEQAAAAGPHSQMPLWLIGATGSAVLAVGLALVLVDRARRYVWPLAAAGQLALTIYVGHLVALHVAPDRLTSDDLATAVWLLAGFVVVAVAAATLWRTWFDRGPLELALSAPWLVRRRPRSVADQGSGAAAGDWSTSPGAPVRHRRPPAGPRTPMPGRHLCDGRPQDTDHPGR